MVTNEEPHTAARDTSAPRRPAVLRRWWPWLLVVGIGGAAYWLLDKPSTKPQSAAAPGAHAGGPAVPVTAAAAVQGDMPVYLNGLGSVTAFNTVTVKSRVDGQLINVAFREGQAVQQGQLLAEIDPRPFQAQLAQAEGQLARDSAQLKDAKINLERYRDLVAKDFIAKQQYDDQAAQVGQTEGTIKLDQGMVDNAKLQLSYCRITSPINGRIGLRLVDAGNMVHANDQNGLAVITQLQPIAVLFTLPEDQLPPVLGKLRTGQQLSVEAYDRAGKRKIAEGSLLTTDNQIDQTTGTMRLKAVFDNQDNVLFPNQFVNVRLLLDVQPEAIIIPAPAIQRGPQGTFVYVVKGDQTVEVRPVTVGTTEAEDAAIDSGVARGEIVVVDGVDKLRSGSPVQVKTPEADGTARKPRA